MDPTTSPRVEPDNAEHETVDLREWLRSLSVHRWMIIGVASVALAISGFVNFTAIPYYRATIRLLIERQNARVVSFQEIYNLGGATDDYYLTQYKILESRFVAEAAMARMPEDDQAWFATQHLDPVRAFMALRRIRPVTKSRLVDIIAEHPDGVVAERMVEAIVDAYVQHGLDRRSSASSSALARLTKDAGVLQENLIAAQRVAQKFKTDNQIVSMNDRQSLTAARLQKLSEELSRIEGERSEADARLASLDVSATDAVLDRDLPEVLNSVVIGSFKRALLEARAEASQMARTYRPKHPQMRALTGRIESLESQLTAEVRAVYAALDRERRRAVVRQGDVLSRMEAQKAVLLKMEGKAIQYNILRDEAENTRRLHDTVLSRLKEIEVIDGSEATNVHRIGGAEISNKPVRPRKVLNMLFALLIGAALGCGCAFLSEILDRSIKTAADATRILEAPVLGLVPQLGGKRRKRGPLDADTLDTSSTLSEVFRTIRTGLAFAEGSRDVRSLVVTSAAPEEGKSMVSINLAASFARGGKRVLLVDADMRRPRLHRAFSLTAEEGLSSILIGRSTADELACATVIDNLFLLPCGILPPSPVELLSDGLTPELVDGMLESFDMVIFDSPPAGVVSDACVIGTRADQVLFVVCSASTDRGLSRQAVGQLRNVGARVGGLILNQADSRSGRYEYTYQSRYALSSEEQAAEVQA